MNFEKVKYPHNNLNGSRKTSEHIEQYKCLLILLGSTKFLYIFFFMLVIFLLFNLLFINYYQIYYIYLFTF